MALYDTRACVSLCEAAMGLYMMDYKTDLYCLHYYDILKKNAPLKYKGIKDLMERRAEKDEDWILSADFDFWALQALSQKDKEGLIRSYRELCFKDFYSHEPKEKISILFLIIKKCELSREKIEDFLGWDEGKIYRVMTKRKSYTEEKKKDINALFEALKSGGGDFGRP